MPDDNEIKVEPSHRVDELLAPIPAFTSRCVAAIAFGPAGERPRNVATVTAVKIAGADLLVTAKHVAGLLKFRRLPVP